MRACRLALLWVLPLVVAVVAACGRGTPPPPAVNGKIDLSTFGPALARGQTVSLRGTWLLYWDRLLGPSAFAGGGDPPGAAPVPVPGEWWTVGLPATGFATLRLDVLVPPGAGPLAVQMPYVCTAYRMWANGAPVAAAGVVGTGPATEQPAFRPVLAMLPPVPAGGGTMRLVLQVSNFHHRCGGFDSAPELGAQPLLQTLQVRERALGGVVAGAIFAIMAAGLFVFARWPADRSNLYFGLFCLFALIRILVTGAMPLTVVRPGLPFGVQLRLEYLGDFAAPLALVLFLRVLYPGEVNVWVLRWQGVATLAGLLSLFWPLRLSSWLMPWDAIELVAFGAYACGAIGLAAWRRREGARLLLVAGAVPLLASLAHDDLVYAGVVAGKQLLPLGMFALVFAQTAFLAERLARAFGELRRSQQVLVDREDELRKEIAERLHGPVQTQLLLAGQDLDEALRLLEAGGGSDAAREVVRSARLKVDGVRERDIRRVSHDLHPTVVDIGLVPAAHSVAQRYTARLAVHVDIAQGVLALDAEVPSAIPEPVRLGVYRILEEALANVHAHAEARRADVRLALGPGPTLVVQVRDDGRGLPGGRRPAAGLGLRSIAARVSALGGRWSISGRPGRGVLLEAVLPLRPGRGAAPTPFPRPEPGRSPADTPALPGRAIGSADLRDRSQGLDRSR